MNLREFLAGRSIYSTARFHDHPDAQARTNLERSLRALA